MQKKISSIAHVYSGYTFRGAIADIHEGEISVVQAKDIQTNQEITSTSHLVKIPANSLRSPNFLESGDVLIVSRGSGHESFRAAVFRSNEKKVMSSSSVHVIRIKDVTILPKYLCLYLNSKQGQLAISQIVTGATYLQSVLIKDLLTLEIAIPSIHIQKSIIALYENMMNQEQIVRRKIEIQKIIIDTSFANLTNK